MKVIENAAARQTTLNDIPVGQVFRGRIRRIDGSLTPQGIYFKAEGPIRCGDRANQVTLLEAEVVVVRLDLTQMGVRADNRLYKNLGLYCREVVNYEPLDVELVVKGVL